MTFVVVLVTGFDTIFGVLSFGSCFGSILTLMVELLPLLLAPELARELAPELVRELAPELVRELARELAPELVRELV